MRGFGYGMGYHRIAREMRYYIRRQIYNDSKKYKTPDSFVGDLFAYLVLIFMCVLNPYMLIMAVPAMIIAHKVRRLQNEERERMYYDQQNKD